MVKDLETKFSSKIKNMETLAKNKIAFRDYSILEKFEAGIVLRGHETKSVKNGKMSLRGSFVLIRNNEAFLINASIHPYQPLNLKNEYDAERTKKLLLRKKELNYLIGKIKERGLTLVPLSVYTNRHSKVKICLGLGKGKRKFDKREAIKKREAERTIRRYLKRG